MEKHEKMVLNNRIRSQNKVDKAVTEIKRMLTEDEQVVVGALVKRTGLSRAFFYNNRAVHEELIRAQDIQEGKSFVTQQKVIINKAVDREIDLLKKKLVEKEQEIDRLKAEMVQLKKAANAKALTVWDEL